jgi:hypothetical protein
MRGDTERGGCADAFGAALAAVVHEGGDLTPEQSKMLQKF